MINLLSGFSELRTFPLPSVSLVVLTCSGSQQILLPGGYCSDASPDLAPWNEQTSWCAYSTTCDGIYCKRQEQFFTALNWQYEKLYQRQQELLFLLTVLMFWLQRWSEIFFFDYMITTTECPKHVHVSEMDMLTLNFLKWCWISHHHGLFPGGPLSVRDLPPKLILTLSNSLKIEMCLFLQLFLSSTTYDCWPFCYQQ